MAITAGNNAGQSYSEINMTPLIDVMLVLLIIFIITIAARLRRPRDDVGVALEHLTQTRPENITIAVDKQGAIYWNTVLLTGQDDLLQRLRGIARQEPQPEVHIQGDSNVRYQFVGQVLVATQKIGIRKVAFITEPDRPTSR